MLTPAQEQALQAQMLANGGGGAALPPVATNALPTPTPGEIFPSVTTSMPIAPGSTSTWTAKKEGAEAEEKRHAADTADVASANALKAATLGTTEAPTAPPKIAEVPAAAPTGEGLGGGIQQGSSLPEQKQINALSVAAAQKQFEDRKRAEQDALEEKKKARVQAWTDEFAAAKAKYAEIAAEPTQDNSWTSRLLRGLAAGLGAYGAAITHSPNYAQQIMDAQVNRAIEEKRDKMRQMESRLEKLGAHPEVIDKWADKQWALTLGKLQADLDRVKTASDVMLARFPQAQLEANKMIAEKQATVADEVAKRSATVGERTVGGGTNLPASVVQEVQPGSDKLGDKRLPTTVDTEKAAAAEENGKLASRLKEIWKDPANRYTASELREIKDLENEMMSRQHTESESVWQSKLGKAGRLTGILPTSKYPASFQQNPKKVEAYLLDQRLTHSHLFSEAGTGWTSNPEAREMFTESRVTSASDSPETIDMKVRNTIDANETIAKRVAEVSKAGRQESMIERSAAAPAQTPAQKRYTEDTAKQIAQDQRGAGKLRGLSAEDTAALKWAATHSKDPRAKAIREQLTAQTKGAQ